MRYDIFLSYASQDRQRIIPLVDLLTSQGWRVWWDREIIPGEEFHRAIDRAISDSRCVLVVWSSESVHSNWVLNEALEGLERSVLVPTMIDAVRLPVGFKVNHGANLAGWPEEKNESELERLFNGLSKVIAGGSTTGGPITSVGAERVPGPAAPPKRANVLAVLPFSERSGGDDYLGEGIQEELIHSLSQIHNLNIVGRTAATPLVKEGLDAVSIGKQLGASFVLEGTVRRAGDKVRVSAQVITIPDGRIVWSETSQRDFTDIFEIQDTIARSIASSLRLRLVGDATDGQQVGTHNPEAYDLNLRARYHFYQYTPREINQAIRLFEQAHELDPHYVSPICGLADAYLQQAMEEIKPTDVLYPKIESLLEQALSLDPDNAHALALKGAMCSYFRWDWLEAAQLLSRAMELSPDDAYILYLYAHWYLCYTGRSSLAIGLMRHIENLEPNSVRFKMFYVWILYLGKRYKESLAKCDEADELQQDLMPVTVTRAWNHAYLGNAEDCRAAFGEIGRIMGMRGVPDYAEYLLTGDRAFLDRHIQRLEARFAESRVGASDIAQAWLDANEHDKSIEWLRIAVDCREPLLPIRLTDFVPHLEEREDFQAVLRATRLDSESMAQLIRDEPTVKIPTF